MAERRRFLHSCSPQEDDGGGDGGGPRNVCRWSSPVRVVVCRLALPYPSFENPSILGHIPRRLPPRHLPPHHRLDRSATLAQLLPPVHCRSAPSYAPRVVYRVAPEQNTDLAFSTCFFPCASLPDCAFRGFNDHV